MICRCPPDENGELCRIDPGEHAVCSWCRAGHDAARWLENYQRVPRTRIVTCHVCGAEYDSRSEEAVFSAGLWECYDESACMERLITAETEL